MHVIPVIDLKDGRVVRGVGGQRDHYRPIRSQLVTGAEPGPVAAALAELTVDRSLYVADLDAIAGAAPNWEAYQQIFASASSTIIDAGIRTPDQAKSLVDFAAGQNTATSVVVALESCAGPENLREVFARIGGAQAVFSLDLQQGRPLTEAPAWQKLQAAEIVTRAVEVGFQRVIVLDLAAVGVEGGPTVIDLCRDLRAQHPGLELISGGGVRSVRDLQLFHDAGCDGVLVASALHDGRITRRDLQTCNFLRR